MQKLTKLINKLTDPVVNDLKRFLSLIFLQTFAIIAYCVFILPAQLPTYDWLFHLFSSLVYSFVISYAIVLIVSILPKKWGGYLLALILTYIAIIEVAHVFCLWTIHHLFDEDYACVVLGTNLSEATEFFSSSFLSAAKILGIILSLLAPVLAYYLFKYITRKRKPSTTPLYLRISLLVLFCVAIPLCIRYSQTEAAFESPVLFYKNFRKYVKIPDIKPTNPSLNSQDKTDIPTIVVIIGESLGKNHCSLYGYKYDTNPLLSTYPDSLLHVFKHVESAGIHTQSAFARFMTTADASNEADWYKSDNIIEIAKKVSYRTTWISNQSKHGLFDNQIGKIANLCDTSIWNGNQLSGLHHLETDDGLIPIVRNYNNDSSKSLIFVHLMGSHERFNKRYPANFAKFKPSDYTNYPASQRQDRAEYDNSVFFNDYVVSSLINTYAKKDAVILYFSDHALDIYDSCNNHCAHAIKGDKRSEYFARQIPFMIYTSAEFREKHSEVTKLIENAVDKHINTTDLPYIMMQLLGVTFTDRPNKAVL